MRFTTLIFSIIFDLTLSLLTSQTITLDSCYVWVRKTNPMNGQYDLINRTKDPDLKNIQTKNLPRIRLAGQATYQSDVTEIPFMAPGLDVPAVSKDQYKVYGEITQPLTQFNTIQKELDLAKINYDIQKQELDVSLRQLKNQVNTLFFGILNLEAQVAQSQITQEDIKNGIHRLNTAVEFGTALPSDVNELQAELLQQEQKIYTLQSRKVQLIRMMSLLTGQSMDRSSNFQKPTVPKQSDQLNRPELDLYSLQQNLIERQKSLFHQKIKPRVSLFLQGGYGKPTLNFLDDSFSAYYLGGVRLNWDISSFYTRKRKDQIWEIHERSIDLKKENFTLNTKIQMEQYDEEIQRYRDLLQSDHDIINLRASIKETADKKLTRGVITPADYLSLVYKEEHARRSMALHQILLLQASYNRIYENGN